MACRTYRPHIQLQTGRRWNSLIGWFDVSALGLRWWECEGHGARGDGKTPKEAYDAWYRDFIRPYRNNSVFMAAYRAANTPR
jgi:hypothetical protein